VLALGVRRAWESLGVEQPHDLHDWATRYALTPWDRRVLDAYRPGTPYTDQALAALRVIPGIRAKAAFVYAHVVPERQNLQARGTTHRAAWRRAWTRVRARRRMHRNAHSTDA
jgi:hypothetical protein